MYTGKGAFLKNFLAENHGQKAVRAFEQQHQPLTHCSETLNDKSGDSDGIRLTNSPEFEFDDILPKKV